MRLQFWCRSARTLTVMAIFCLVAGPIAASNVTRVTRGTDKIPPLNVVEIPDPDGVIVSYRHLAGSTEVTMRGTQLAPDAHVRLKVGSRPGFVELDINRGGISGLKKASALGRDFLTYVLWAVSVDGRASNLGEITFDTERAVAVNVTTPYQTFWLMITAEPNYAVVDPSPQVVLYSVKQAANAENKAMVISTHLFYFTHYATYRTERDDVADGTPNQLLQARKAVELASKSAALASLRPNPRPAGRGGRSEEEFTRSALSEASSFLARAEQAYVTNPRSQEVAQLARTAAQSAENARALAMGAVGGLVIRQLQDELEQLRGEITRLRGGEPAKDGAGSDPRPGLPSTTPPVATAAPVEVISVPLAKQPAIWFAVAGWLLAIVVLFRRRPA